MIVITNKLTTICFLCFCTSLVFTQKQKTTHQNLQHMKEFGRSTISISSNFYNIQTLL